MGAGVGTWQGGEVNGAKNGRNVYAGHPKRVFPVMLGCSLDLTHSLSALL